MMRPWRSSMAVLTRQRYFVAAAPRGGRMCGRSHVDGGHGGPPRPRKTHRSAVILMLSGLMGQTGWAQVQVIYTDDFETSIGLRWTGWTDLSWVPPQGICNQPVNCFGPQMLFNDGSHAHDGSLAARQEQAQPWWYGSVHDEPSLADHTRDTIHLTAWQFEDFNKQAPFPPGDPNFNAHDQVQGWLALMSEDESDVFILGVHAHKASSPVADAWWQNIAWKTQSDGWHVTSFPRAQGWRKLGISLHAYTGEVGDAEFFVNDVKVGEGRRVLQSGCTAVPVTRIGLGANPAHVPESYLANTYEFFWYDELTLSVEPISPCPNPELRFDADDDGDLDQDDFGAFQRCITGPGDPDGAFECLQCRCMDADGDADVDGNDFGAFQVCLSGPTAPADPACDDGLPPPQ